MKTVNHADCFACQECGRLITPYYKNARRTAADGAELRICYPCAEKHESAEFATAAAYGCYLSSDGRHVTTWTGGALAAVTYRKRHRGGFGGEFYTVDATAPDGSRWYGRGGGPGMYLKLRRRKRA